MTWQPIETAPKDGTWIILGKPDWSVFLKARWVDVDGDDGPFKAWVFQYDGICLGVDDGVLGWQEDHDDGAMPTHWMPLPSPPEAP